MSAVTDKIKSWMFPGLITILASMLWYDIREIKTDVKALMAQSNVDKTRIDNLERVVYDLPNRHTNLPENEEELPPSATELLFVRPENHTKKKIYRPSITSIH